MHFEDYLRKKQVDKIKQLKFFSNIFLKKLKYDSKIKLNKSESKKIIKNLDELDHKNEIIFKHYSKVEKELIEYIAQLNVNNYQNEGKLTPEIKQINEYNLKILDILKKKRIKILEQKRKELEQIIDNYQINEEIIRDNIIYDKVERDYLVFKKLNEAKREIEKLVPKFKYFEKEINSITKINNELKRKYNCLQIENKCLLSLLNKLNNKHIKILNNNSIVMDNNININKSLILNSKKIKNKSKFPYNINENKKLLYTSRLKKNNSVKSIKYSSNSANIASNSNRLCLKKNNSKLRDKIIKNNIFISQNKSIYSQIIDIKKNKNRCVSAKIIDKNNNEDLGVSKNKYIIKLLKILISTIEQKYNEKHILYTKELEIQNKIRNLINLCVEDLNLLYKEYKGDKFEIIKTQNDKKNKAKNKEKEIVQYENNIKKIEKQIFIFSYIYDSCLNNGEIKELKRQYSMFQQKNKI